MLETSKRTADGHSNGNHGESSPQMMSLLPDVVMLPGAILKRDGRLVPFEAERIENAIAKCFASLGYKPGVSAFDLTQQVVNIVSAKYTQPTVESVQDIVEMVLQAAGEFEAAKRYILYRAEHAKMRDEAPDPRGGAGRLRRFRPVFPHPAAEVPVLRQVLALQLRSGPPRNLDRDR